MRAVSGAISAVVSCDTRLEISIPEPTPNAWSTPAPAEPLEVVLPVDDELLVVGVVVDVVLGVSAESAMMMSPAIRFRCEKSALSL